jgi:hypothetical protein
MERVRACLFPGNFPLVQGIRMCRLFVVAAEIRGNDDANAGARNGHYPRKAIHADEQIGRSKTTLKQM